MKFLTTFRQGRDNVEIRDTCLRVAASAKAGEIRVCSWYVWIGCHDEFISASLHRVDPVE
jgi:hypothetical protein